MSDQTYNSGSKMLDKLFATTSNFFKIDYIFPVLNDKVRIDIITIFRIIR
jgi:hypothetical protein